jgi:hypothetical protein
LIQAAWQGDLRGDHGFRMHSAAVKERHDARWATQSL